MDMAGLDRFVAEANVRRFRRMLNGPLSDDHRPVLLELLRNEEEKLKAIRESEEVRPGEARHRPDGKRQQFDWS